jgi:HAD superfamily hydrolase (TIGR01509 family)
MQRIKAVLLDMDGVVIDSEPLHEEAQRIIFREFDLPVPEIMLPSFKGLTEKHVFEKIVAEFGDGGRSVDELIEAKEQAYRALLKDLQMIPGALSFIERAHRVFRLALTTSSIRQDQRIAFDRFDLDPFFDAVVTAEDIDRPKPHPEPYLVTAGKLGLDPAVCLVVEDSLNGVRSGVAAGCFVVGMTTSFGADKLSSAGAHLIVDTFDELSAHLRI